MAAKEEEKDPIITVTDQEPEKVVTGGDLNSSSEDDEEKVVQKTKPVRKRGNDQQKRLNEIWLGRKEAEEEANRQAQIATSERAKNAQYEQITASALEESLNIKRELLKERLLRAEDTQDNKAKTDITAELSKVEAQSAQIERYKIESRIQPQQQQPTQERQVRQEQVSPEDAYEQMSPAGKKWLDENNDWYASDSENHDPDKSGDVRHYAQSLERELASSGRAAEIGTRAYFNKINEYITKNWSDNVNNESDEGESAPVVQPKKNYAAPVGNRNAVSTPSGGRKEYKITQAEKEMALSLDSKDEKGRLLSDSDKIKRFVGLRDSTPQSGPISMKTLNNKGA